MLVTKYDHQAIVARVDHATPNLFVLECHTNEDIQFTSGQYMTIVLPDAHSAPFSIASSPAEPNKFEFGIGVTGGPVTTVLTQMRPDDKITLRGPFGKFILNGEQKICLLAGGVGVTPFMSMLRWARDKNLSTDIILCYSGKTQEQLLWRDELITANKEHPNLRTIFTLTEEKPTNWPFKLGRIDDKLLRENVNDIAQRTVYCCGPPTFIAAMRQLAIGLGVPNHKFIEEKW